MVRRLVRLVHDLLDKRIRHKRIDESMLYVHVAEAYARRIEAVMLGTKRDRIVTNDDPEPN